MRKVIILSAGLLLAWSTAAVTDVPSIERDPVDLGIPFTRYTTRDKFGRRITCYLSKAEKKPLPLLVFVQGSGRTSQFAKRGDKITGGWQNILLEQAKGRARVLVVEKPGVQFLDAARRPGSAEDASREFLEEHTLPRWVEAVSAAIRAAQTLADVDRGKTLVVGHSEGGIVAAHVAAENPHITHVACLASSGPSQLFDLAELARVSRKPEEPAKERELRVQQVYEAWDRIQADPDSITQFYKGHPYRRWSSFLRTSTLDGLERCKARIYLAHGTEDAAVPVASFDVLRAALATRGRALTAERLEGLDHGFRAKDATGPEGMRAVLVRVVEWFFKAGGS